MINNVFDEMYKTRVRESYDWFGGSRSTLFANMKQLERIRRDTELFYTQEGFFEERYKEEYLEENQDILIYFRKEEKEVHFSLKLEFPETNERIWLEYQYEMDSKTLTKKKYAIVSPLYEKESHFNTNEDDIKDFLLRHDLTRSDIEELHDWFFYDKILADWFEGNGTKTRFSLDNLGKYTFVNAE